MEDEEVLDPRALGRIAQLIGVLTPFVWALFFNQTSTQPLLANWCGQVTYLNSIVMPDDEDSSDDGDDDDDDEGEGDDLDADQEGGEEEEEGGGAGG